ncbi:cadherin-related family member 5 [Hyperolius riggenbachi]|uniref:cadherin-related family member 5 n=1 Tax=Hyperolius riggenbachi TaxID=752182 RepID=UPI0035A3CCDF
MGPILALFIFISIPLGCLSQECVVDKETVQIPENNVEKVVVTNISLGEGYTVEVETHMDKFIIEGSSLVLNVSVDYEVDRYFQVNLVCKLHGNYVATRFVIVQIIDVNDNPPVFKDVLYSHSVSEDQKVNTAIGLFIEATDLDASDIIYYELLGSDMEAVEYFKLSSATNPDILVNKTLDYDLCPRVHMNITARDTQLPGVTPSHTATASIIIDIIDADDKPPFFLPCTPIGTKVCFNTGYTGTVNRSQQATEPLNLEPGPLYAVDGDYGINDVIVYDILSGNEDAVFAVDRSSGNITMSKSIDTVRTINLLVMASQISDASKQTTTTVRIDVKEKNLYPPIFENDNYHGVVSTHSEIETFVMNSNNEKLKVFAADGDFPDKVNPSIEYKIENSTDFAIFSNGYIWTKTVFTSPGTAVILVSATDRITLETTSTLVTVEIIAAPTTVATTTRTSTFTTSHTPWTGSTTSNTGPTGNVNPSTTTKATITGTGTSTTRTPGTGTTTTTTPGTGTTTTTTPGTGTTTTTTPGTGTTTTTTPGTGTTTTTTPGTGTTTTTTPGTGTTTTTTPGTGTTTTTTPGTSTTTTTTPGTGTTTTTTPVTGTTTTTTPGTGTTTTTPPGTGTTTTTTIGTGTTTTTTPGTGSVTTIRPTTGTTTTTTTGTGTTTTTTNAGPTTTPSTGSTTTTTPSTGTTTTTTKGTDTTSSKTLSTGTITTTSKGTGTTAIFGTGTTITTKNTGTETGITSPRTTIIIGTDITSTAPNTQATSTTTGNNTPTDDGGSVGALNHFSSGDMAALGASLGAVLIVALAGLGFLIHKQYGDLIRSKFGRSSGDGFGDSEDRTAQLIDDNTNSDQGNDNPDLDGVITEEPSSSNVNLVTAVALGSALLKSSPVDTEPSGTEEKLDDADDDSDDNKVKSILTKEFKEDAGYKAVWFREDAAPEVVVIEGVEEAEADDDDDDDDEAEEDINNQEENDDDDDDEEELDLAFNFLETGSNNVSVL